MTESEIQFEASLDLYNTQLEQVALALAAATDESSKNDLTKLLGDLTELVALTEDSLLNIKKKNLLNQLGEPGSKDDLQNAISSAASAATAHDMDAEFAAFKAAIGEEEDHIKSCTPPPPSIPEGGGHAGEDDMDFSEVIGSKCCVKYSHAWGEWRRHNALVLSVEPLQIDSEPKVRVLFCNPTHESMLPCPFFLEDRCKFSEDQCKFSHGYVVSVVELEEFQEPDYSELKMESRCLARYEKDDLWYKAIVVDILEDNKFTVMFDSYGNTETVEMEDLLPLDSEESDSQSDSGEVGDVAGEDTEEDAAPVFLWRPPKTDQAMGEWEKHTRGIGSKLMAKMGYVVGQGLGKHQEGRAEPVPIQLLPQGKSLDKIMEMRERTGDQDLFDVMKRQRRRQKKLDSKVAKCYDVPAESLSVFNFLNKKLRGKKGNVKDLLKHMHHTKIEKRHITEKDLKSKSDRDLNIQMLKTREEIKTVDRELARLQESLIRNDGNDTTIRKIKQKISSVESYKQQLILSENSMQRHHTMRKDRKKMAVF